MTMMTNIAGAAGLAALAAAPAAAQYGAQYGSPYGVQYGAPYGNAYGYNNNISAAAAQRCSAAVQQRLNNRSGSGVSGVIASLLGASRSTGRVLGITQVNQRRSDVRVRGVASSGASNGYGPYGVGAYGALAYANQPDLTFRCDVDYRGYVRNVDINRR